LNAQQEAVALWKHWESRGVRPSIRMVVIGLRSAGIKVRNEDASRFLSAFAAVAPHPKTNASRFSGTHRERMASAPRSASGITKQTDGERITSDFGSASGIASEPPHVRAVESLSLEDNSPSDLRSYGEPASAKLAGMIAGPPSPSEPSFALEPPPPKSVQRRDRPLIPRADTRTPEQKVADTALALMRPRIEAELTLPNGTQPKPWSRWRAQNRQAAVEMAAGGMTAEEIDEAHRAHSESRGRTATLVLAYVQNDMLNAHASRKPDPTDRLENVIPRPDVLDRMIPGDI